MSVLPSVAIVGRPNVGKSTLFNRLLGERKAIVHDSPGVTRDRHYGKSFWAGREFQVIDTGGWVPDDMDVMIAGIRDQVELALEEADVIVWVVDVSQGIHPLDEAVAELLRRQPKPVVLVANKADNVTAALNHTEFYNLGLPTIIPVSAISGSGTGELLDAVTEYLPETVEEEITAFPKLAIVGRPNVGKSSLVNALLGKNRSIVTDIAGTTRDTINSELEWEGKTYTLLDTAGLRRKARVRESIEFYSTLRTEKAIQECDIAIVVIDAVQGLEAQDIKILTEAERFNKGIILAFNKWDKVEKDENTFFEYEKFVSERWPTFSYIPVISISAINKLRLNKLMALVDTVLEERRKEITTSALNEFIREVLASHPLPEITGSPLKIKYATMVKSNPPVFLFFMNNPEYMPAHYRRFLESRLRERFGFVGVPVTMSFREKRDDR
jgi:GTP-binding protein